MVLLRKCEDMVWFQEWWIGLGLVGQVMACCAVPMTVILFLQALLMLLGFGSSIGSDSDTDLDFDSDTDFDGDVDIDSDYDMDFDTGDGIGIDTEYELGDINEDVIPAIIGGSVSDVSGGVNLSDTAHYAGSHDNEHQGYGIVKVITVRGIVAFFAIGGWAGIAALSMGIRSIWAINIALIAGLAALLLASAVIRFALRMQSSGNIDLRNAVSGTGEVYITIPPARSGVGKITMTLQERFVELEAVTDSESAIRPRIIVEIVGVRDRDCLIVKPVEQSE